MRASVVLAAALLLVPAFVQLSGPARASAPLAADAGNSQILSGQIALSGRAIGGVAPYSFSWSDGSSQLRFAHPDAWNATFDPSGLTADPTLVLTVTDADGSTATDSVVEHAVVGAPSTLVDQDIDIGPGTGVGLVGLSMPTDTVVPFVVPAGAQTVHAVLTWDDPTGGVQAYTIYLDLQRPDGSSADFNQGHDGISPTTMDVAARPGAWNADIEPTANAPTTGHLLVTAVVDATQLPVFDQLDIYPRYGTMDDQFGHQHAVGAQPMSYAWDMDGDGVYEASGDIVHASLPLGLHPAHMRATDPSGYRVEAERDYEVVAFDHVLRMSCGGNPHVPTWSMEYADQGDACFIHGGHETFFFGGTVYELHDGDGAVYSVEHQMAPSLEAANANATAPIHIETSVDGQTWTDVGSATFRYLPADPNEALNNLGDEGLPVRQLIFLSLHGNGEHFRFVRVHDPISAGQGLSGYLDFVALFLNANEVGAVPTPTTATQTKELACANGDVIEDFIAAHPCTFGGVDRYDSASFWHTYVAGDGATLTRIGGSFALAPFRTDDYNNVETPLPFLGAAETPSTNASRSTDTYAVLETSIDGQSWTRQATIPAKYGVAQAFSIDVPGGQAAMFVRLVPERHPQFDEWKTDPNGKSPLHHFRGFFLASNLTLEGDLPVA